MSVLIVLVAASLSVALFFLAAFIWSVRSDQFDDKSGAAIRMLHDNPPTPSESSKQIKDS